MSNAPLKLTLRWERVNRASDFTQSPRSPHPMRTKRPSPGPLWPWAQGTLASGRLRPPSLAQQLQWMRDLRGTCPYQTSRAWPQCAATHFCRGLMQPASSVCPIEAPAFRLSLSLKRKTLVYVTRNILFTEPQVLVIMQQREHKTTCICSHERHLRPKAQSCTSTRGVSSVLKSNEVHPVTAIGIYNTFYCLLIQT